MHEAQLDDLLPYQLNRLLAQMNQQLGERLSHHGYSFQMWRILAVLAAHDGITISQLAEAAVIPQPTASRLVAQLQERGFTDRRSSAADSRSVELSITTKGKEAYAEMLPLVISDYRGVMEGLEPAEIEQMRKVVHRMMANAGLKLIER